MAGRGKSASGVVGAVVSVLLGVLLVAALAAVLVPGQISSLVDSVIGSRGSGGGSAAGSPDSSGGDGTNSSGASQAPANDPGAACMSRIPLTMRIGQTMLVILGDPERARASVRSGRVAGIMANGIVDEARARSFLSVAGAAGPAGIFIAADEEGGKVQRYRPVTTSLPAARTQARTMTTDQVRQMYAAHGRELVKWGVKMAMAPSLDVGFGPGIGERSYSDDPQVVAAYGTAVAQGYADAGITSTVKHWPGHGKTTGDTHLGPATGPDLKTILTRDLVPFEKVAAAVPGTAIMASHVITPGLSAQPASQSREALTGLLRGRLGYTGLIVGDALGMAGSQAPDQGTALVRFLSAGGDLGIVGIGGSREGMSAVRAALKAGQLAEARVNDAALMVLRYKGIDPCSLADSLPGTGTTNPDESSAPIETDAPVVNPTLNP